MKAESVLAAKDNRKAGETAAELGERAWGRLAAILGAYNNPDTGYLSRRAPFSEALDGNYDHLARVAEWSSGGDDDSAGADD